MLNKLAKSFIFRQDLLQNPDNILRLSAGAADDLPGLIIDKFGQLIVATLYNQELAPMAEKILEYCVSNFSEHFVIVRIRDNSVENSYRFLFSDLNIPSQIIAEENGIKYEIRFDVRHDFGIFRDAAAARNLLAKICVGKSVLNLFAYTCAFGVTASFHGANRVANVDPNKDYLTWGKKNAELNKIDFAVIPDTSQKYLARQINKMQKGVDSPYDIIITDPPAFGVGRGADRTLRNYWPLMLKQLADLNPSEIIILCNDRSIKDSNLLNSLIRETLFEYKVETISHLADVTGQKSNKIDQWYQPPRMLHLHK